MTEIGTPSLPDDLKPFLKEYYKEVSRIYDDNADKTDTLKPPYQALHLEMSNVINGSDNVTLELFAKMDDFHAALTKEGLPLPDLKAVASAAKLNQAFALLNGNTPLELENNNRHDVAFGHFEDNPPLTIPSLIEAAALRK